MWSHLLQTVLEALTFRDVLWHTNHALWLALEFSLADFSTFMYPEVVVISIFKTVFGFITFGGQWWHESHAVNRQDVCYMASWRGWDSFHPGHIPAYSLTVDWNELCHYSGSSRIDHRWFRWVQTKVFSRVFQSLHYRDACLWYHVQQKERKYSFPS